jgi:hypothetical protein
MMRCDTEDENVLEGKGNQRREKKKENAVK